MRAMEGRGGGSGWGGAGWEARGRGGLSTLTGLTAVVHLCQTTIC